MNFDRYRASIIQVQQMADNFTSLKREDLSRLNSLNAECISLHEEIVKSFSSLVDEIEDGLTLLLERLDQIKKDLAKTSGPNGTLGDILQLEPVWRQANALHHNIRDILGPGSQDAARRDESGNNNAPDTAAAPAQETRTVQEIIGPAREEAAAALEKSTAAVKTQKKDGQESGQGNKKPSETKMIAQKGQLPKRDQKLPPPGQNTKLAPLIIDKNLGETEKKLVEEITKNIEIIKSNKKKL
ncbi:MAG: hypothetical protein K6T65_05055 [Peptococcaceae bacterium]|nr:hypothetical protein [Peptococcaceae bacterium]